MIKLWIVWVGVLVHIIWGLMCIIGDNATNSTIIVNITDWLYGNCTITGIVLIVVGLMTLTALLLNGRMKTYSLLLTAPQQFFLVVHAGYAIESLILEESGTGAYYPWDLLMMVHAPVILLAIFHNLAIINHHWGRNHEC